MKGSEASTFVRFEKFVENIFSNSHAAMFIDPEVFMSSLINIEVIGCQYMYSQQF